jgi:mannose-6-phosphate isomerase-like protein (cupin superfamily)
MFERDWARFDYWFRVHRGLRRPQDDGRTIASLTPSHGSETSRSTTSGGAGNRSVGAAKAAVRFARVGAALFLLTIAVAAPAKTISHSSSSAATVIASTTLPDVAAEPLYIRLVGGRLPSDEVSGTSTADGFFYQLSGTTEISIDDKTTIVAAGEAALIPRGATVTLKAGYRLPSLYLQFLLSPAPNSDLPEAPNGHEIYRSSSPIRGLRPGNYVLNLTKVTLPQQAPPDLPHRRSGAALHVVLSGFGAETADGTTVARSPGSVSFEPATLVYQWSNPGNLPLTYLVFNFNPESADAIVAAAPQSGPQR